MKKFEIKRIKSLAVMFAGFTTIFYTYSCIEDVPDDILPKAEPKLVVESFISPNDTIRVRICKSLPINYNYYLTSDDQYNEFPPLRDASVSIRNTHTGDPVSIPYDSLSGFYVLYPSQFSVEKGQEYELKVNHTELGETIARTRVPSSTPDLLSVKIDTVEVHTYEGVETDYDLVISGIIKDTGGEKNFYRIIFTFYYCYEYDYVYCYTDMVEKLISDTGSDGQELPFTLYIYGYSWQYYKVKILSTDINYYHFHRTLENWSEGNPFVEPTPVYSNIEGGLGIFGSYLEVAF
ncbi:MAG TPA: DUF4249 domain-containing protein [Tenuifilaceae bacterium]|nr:DUF4249 domain-containing protein [Tenuifilaceae bacterium]